MRLQVKLLLLSASLAYSAISLGFNADTTSDWYKEKKWLTYEYLSFKETDANFDIFAKAMATRDWVVDVRYYGDRKKIYRARLIKLNPSAEDIPLNQDKDWYTYASSLKSRNYILSADELGDALAKLNKIGRRVLFIGKNPNSSDTFITLQR